jgi:hypothetical protein
MKQKNSKENITGCGWNPTPETEKIQKSTFSFIGHYPTNLLEMISL